MGIMIKIILITILLISTHTAAFCIGKVHEIRNTIKMLEEMEWMNEHAKRKAIAVWKKAMRERING